MVKVTRTALGMKLWEGKAKGTRGVGGEKLSRREERWGLRQPYGGRRAKTARKPRSDQERLKSGRTPQCAVEV